MYESGTEFKIILSDYYCPHKIDGKCNHNKWIEGETGHSIKWCDKKICPIKSKGE